MKPKSQDATAFELFQAHAHFDTILNTQHPLIQLAGQIDWPRFDAAFADSYNEKLVAPGKAHKHYAHKHYEFGQKVGLATTNRSNW